jgi:hypothetical protein
LRLTVTGLVAVGDFEKPLLKLPQKPYRSTKAQNLHFCPYCYKPLLAEVAVNLQGLKFIKSKRMKAIEMLELTKKYADKYSEEAKTSLVRNNHMNEIKKDEDIDQRIIDAVLVDFINFIGVKHGIDYALYTSDLRKS